MAKSPLSVADRFWRKALPEPNSGCWLWTGAVGSGGYGHFGIGSRSDGTRRSVTASRFAYELSNGLNAAELNVLHSCDNPLCVNPEHLSEGTRSQNMQEAYDRGRQPFRGGEENGRAKLNEDDVRNIRISSETTQALAKKHGCSRAAIHSARTGKTWRHIDG